jgi:hypothetical protein
MFPVVYVSKDDVERADAHRFGYRAVCTHPGEIGNLDLSDILIIDFNFILFDDHECAIAKANEHALRGALVGIHTYRRAALKRHRLVALPNVLVAKTHHRLFAKLRRYAKVHGLAWHRVLEAANSDSW